MTKVINAHTTYINKSLGKKWKKHVKKAWAFHKNIKRNWTKCITLKGMSYKKSNRDG